MGSERLETVWVDGVDPVSGEMGKIPVLVGKRVRLKERYMFVFQEMMGRLGRDRRMTGERCRLVYLLLERCDWENWLYVRQKDLAVEAGMRPGQVSRAMRFLVQAGVILRGPHLGRGSAYKLNSHYGYKGKLVNLAQHRRKEGDQTHGH